ncbi:MAG TPA: hypothetical protein VG323_19455, partial [Thermoanaerobaculia bacterium]|nr:hypothetical protein [Thermoanaerobaculia bacterium]
MRRAAVLLLFVAACQTPEEAAHARLMRFVEQHPPGKWTVTDRMEVHRLARAYLDLPHHEHRRWMTVSYGALWSVLRDDPEADRNELLRTAHGMEEYGYFPRWRFVEPARLLAERNIDLDYAEHLARRGIVESHRVFRRHPEAPRPWQAEVIGEAHESLGIVLRKRGPH